MWVKLSLSSFKNVKLWNPLSILEVLKFWLKHTLMLIIKTFSFGIYSDPRDLNPIYFHRTKGSHMEIDGTQTVATRCCGFTNGILFSNRTIEVGERVKLKITRSSIYEGAIYIGFTQLDPEHCSLKLLPEFRLLSRQRPNPGVWLHGLMELKQVKTPFYLDFWLSSRGVMEYTINKKSTGSNFQLEINPVPTDVPLWACLDFSGRFDQVRILNEMAFLTLAHPLLETEESEPEPFNPVLHTSRNAMMEPAFVRIDSPLKCITSQVYLADETSTCIICEDAEVQLALLPCMHLCMCEGCMRDLLDYSHFQERLVEARGLLRNESIISRECPICREAVAGIIGPSSHSA